MSRGMSFERLEFVSQVVARLWPYDYEISGERGARFVRVVRPTRHKLAVADGESPEDIGARIVARLRKARKARERAR